MGRRTDDYILGMFQILEELLPLIFQSLKFSSVKYRYACWFRIRWQVINRP